MAVINALFVWLAIALLSVREKDFETVGQVRLGPRGVLAACTRIGRHRAHLHTAAASPPHFPSLQLQPFYLAEAILAAVSMGALLLSLAWFMLTILRSRREGRLW